MKFQAQIPTSHKWLKDRKGRARMKKDVDEAPEKNIKFLDRCINLFALLQIKY
jgi:hypothetical protein